jgi:glucosamine--fructose-6-phosphate aminotransferase (isomerizing)
LERELREQGAVLEARADDGFAAANEAAGLLRRADVDYVLLAARGSSKNAARYAQYAWGSEARLSTALAAPSLYRDPGRAPKLAGAALIAISQSGRSPDVAAVLATARAQGRPTIAITNEPSSPLGEEADVVVPLLAGEERSVAATKTYLTSLHAVQQILERLRPLPGRREWLERLPSLVHEAVESQLRARRSYTPLVDRSQLTVVGRGMDLATACETALKIRELSGRPAEALSPPDLLHGPIAALARPTQLWLVSAATPVDASASAVLEQARSRGVEVIMVAVESGQASPRDLFVRIDDAPPAWARAILAVVPGQVAALHLAELQTVDVDRPHGLSKITVTR